MKYRKIRSEFSFSMYTHMDGRRDRIKSGGIRKLGIG